MINAFIVTNVINYLNLMKRRKAKWRKEGLKLQALRIK